MNGLLYIPILAVLTVLLIVWSRKRVFAEAAGQLFFLGQAAFAVWVVLNPDTTVWTYFTFDKLGSVYYVLMAALGWLCFWQSNRYLDREKVREYKLYLISFVALNVALTGVYFANNITVTWIFLEATTIAVAGLTYHRRTMQSLEATWKYIFVSSVGIAVAYLGILLLSTVVSGGGHGEADLSYNSLYAAIEAGQGNTLYIKLAFLFILVGYSSKLEIFPFYTVGIDANHSAPTPASAFISSALVGGGFVSLFRVYRILEGSETLLSWTQHVLLLVGLLSVIMAAVYMGRTRNYKRLAAYSTVENSGLAILGLGIGGIGVWAAVLHSLAHTVLKGSLMLQISAIGKTYGGYKISRYGGYFKADPLGGLVLACAVVGLIAMPPSLLFRTEYLMLTELIATGKWWIVLILAFVLLVIIYWLCSKFLPLLYKPMDPARMHPEKGKNPALSFVLLLLILAVFAAGVWQAPELIQLIDTIAYR